MMKDSKPTTHALISEPECERNTAIDATAATAKTDQNRDGFQFVDFSVYLMMAIDTAGHLTMANESLRDTLGYTATDLNSKTFRDIVHPESLDLVHAYLQTVMAGQFVDHFDVSFIAKNGLKIAAEGHAIPRCSDKVVSGAFITCHVMTPPPQKNSVRG